MILTAEAGEFRTKGHRYEVFVELIGAKDRGAPWGNEPIQEVPS